MCRLSVFKHAAAIVLSFSLVVFSPVGAQSGNKGKADKTQKHDQSHETSAGAAGPPHGVSVSIRFEEARRMAVDNRAVGYGALPPGIRKNLAKGKPLPPGIAKKAVPGPMLGKLPVYTGYEWRVCGTDLVLVALGTALVAEVIANVFE